MMHLLLEIHYLYRFHLYLKCITVLNHYNIFSTACQTVVSDSSLWYSGIEPVAFVEEEPEEAVGEPQRVIEWQPDDVM